MTRPHVVASPVLLDGSPLTVAQVAGVARGQASVALAPDTRDRVAASRAQLESLLDDGLPHYGVNTGFGSLARTRIPADQLRDLQQNLVRSHAAGTGAPLPRTIVRATMLLLAASLARGASGVRPEIVDGLVALLNADVTPVVPSIGSVGASGDLAPLAAIARVLIGEGDITLPTGAAHPAAVALARAGLAPLVLEAKEGLALINGTHLMTAEAVLLLDGWDALAPAALVACAMAIDAVKATDAFLDPRVHALRNQPGQAAVAERLRMLLEGTEIVASHRVNDDRVQDPYSFRCAPVVLGAAFDAVEYVRAAVALELGAVTDNPLLVSGPGDGASRTDGVTLVSAGNFHGMPIALPLDVLAIALTHVAGIAQQRVFFMLSARDPESGLPPYLSPLPGLNSGLMVAQYTAAACCNELAGLCMPASVINVPTSAGIEDYNSFGPRAAAKARRAIDLARTVVAIELLCAAQGLDRHRPLRSGDLVERAHAHVREVVPPLDADRPLTRDIEAIAALIANGTFT